MAIHVLDADSAAKIAAGEVVERPASVAKELIENAIDAGATDIRVELKDGGMALLRVVDNGCGIAAEELALAFQRHATSKIGSIDDLQMVATLGFRGEALPSIAAVSEVTLASRRPEDHGGSQLRVHGGQIVEQTSAGCPAGSSVTVRELFYNMPARRKFLKTPLAEGGQVTRLVGHFALAYPGIGFSLLADGRPVFQSSGSGDLLDVIARLYGPEVARGMIPVELNDGLQVRGYVSQPRVSRASRSHISLFVNGRLIQGRSMLHAAEEAYASLLMVGRHPVAVLNVNLDPAQVDVNVHPSKAEVKFAAERQVLARVHQAVLQAVARYAPVPVIELRAPVIGSVPGPAGYLGAYTTAPPAGFGQGDGLRSWPGSDRWAAEADPGGPPGAWVSGSGADGQQAGLDHSERWSAGPSGMLQTLPMLRVLGQLALTYIIAEGPGGLYLIDQHAAHERVRLDAIERSRQNDTGQAPDAQLLLQPLTIEVSPAQAAAAGAAGPALSRLGIEIEPFGDRTYLLRAIPAAMRLDQARDSLAAMLDELAAEASSADWDDAAAHSLACHTAVRAGQPLSPEEMSALIGQLERCWSPQACAHGRPTMVHLSQAQLEREFGRR
ncbi:MAG TPA: DNA mismatch repair endonuclease MutL [Chloroflexota bacterium]